MEDATKAPRPSSPPSIAIWIPNFRRLELFRSRKHLEDRVIDGIDFEFNDAPFGHTQTEPRERQVVVVPFWPRRRDCDRLVHALCGSDSRIGRQLNRRATARAWVSHYLCRRGLTPQRLHTGELRLQQKRQHVRLAFRQIPRLHYLNAKANGGNARQPPSKPAACSNCDIAYSSSPRASRALLWSVQYRCRVASPSMISMTAPKGVDTLAPLPLPSR